MDGHTVYQQSTLASFTRDGDLYATLTTVAHFVTVFTVGVKTLGDRKSGQIDGWREDLLTSNNIFQKQLASSFYFLEGGGA